MQSGSFIEIVTGTLRMCDSTPGCHEVNGTGLNGLYVTQVVAVHDLSFEEVGNGRETYVRMRAHGDAFSGWKFGRSHMIEENKRSDHASLCRGQNTTHRKLAEVTFSGSDCHFNTGSIHLFELLARNFLAQLSDSQERHASNNRYAES